MKSYDKGKERGQEALPASSPAKVDDDAGHLTAILAPQSQLCNRLHQVLLSFRTVSIQSAPLRTEYAAIHLAEARLLSVNLSFR